jgi:branched-chain amino acid transport system permease protein
VSITAPEVLSRRPTRAAIGAVVGVLVWLVARVVLPHGAPLGILLAGGVFGAINSLVAISIVLVYRANRAVNFAAADFGSVAAVVAIELHILEHVNYFIAIATGLVLSGILGAVLEATILRRFSRFPRLIFSVATIGLGQLLNGLSVIVPIEWNSGGSSGTFTTPFNFHLTIFPVVFNGNYLLAVIVVPVVLLALVWFLRYSSYGIAIRAAADNGDRARLLGVPVTRLSTIVWGITGVLSAMAVLLRVPILGFESFLSVSSSGPQLLLYTLAAAVIGSMESLPVTVAASIGLGIVSQLAAWCFHNATYADAALFVVILAVMLVRRERLSRAAETGIGGWQAIRPVRPIPPELSPLREVRIGRHATKLVILAVGLLAPYVLSPAHTQLASLVLLYGMVAASLVVLTGWAGQISLGQVAFMGFGAATTGILVSVHHWDLFYAMGAGAVVAGVVAVLIGIPALRITGQWLAVVTLAFAVTSADYFLDPHFFGWFDPSTTDLVSRMPLFGRILIGSDRQMYYVCLVALAVSLAAVSSLRRAAAGRALIAGNENHLAAESFGIDTTRLKLVAFALSGAIAGLAGGLYVVQQQQYNVSAFPAEDGLVFFAMVVIGGLGSIPGAVLGALYVYGAQYLLPSGWNFLATGAGVLILLMFLPGGLGEFVFRGRDRLLRAVARRRDLVVPSLLADQLTEPGAHGADEGADSVPEEEPTFEPPLLVSSEQ